MSAALLSLGKLHLHLVENSKLWFVGAIEFIELLECSSGCD